MAALNSRIVSREMTPPIGEYLFMSSLNCQWIDFYSCLFSHY